MTKDIIIAPGTETLAELFQYAPAVKVGSTRWVSGVLPMLADGSIPDSLEDQVHAAFQGLKRVLEAAGATLDDIVELVSYHVGFPQGGEIIGAVKAQYITRPYPAWTAVGVTALAMPTALLEIKATAVIGAGR